LRGSGGSTPSTGQGRSHTTAGAAGPCKTMKGQRVLRGGCCLNSNLSLTPHAHDLMRPHCLLILQSTSFATAMHYDSVPGMTGSGTLMFQSVAATRRSDPRLPAPWAQSPASSWRALRRC
jgi:hypothetical protein